MCVAVRVARSVFEDALSHMCWGEGPVLWKRELRIYCHVAIGINVIPSRARSTEGASAPQWEVCLFRYRRDGEGMRGATEV